MFTFEDLSHLDPSSIQTIIRAADKDKLPLALKGATETLRDLFFSNMSERAAKIMKEDMASMGPVRLKEVEEAQQYIVNVAKDLESRGEVVLSKGNAEDAMIY
jgi:flagellar motor switch protein FliG